jgi:hypothetical protein
MPDTTHQGDRPALSREERKQLLVFACAADRVALAHACRPRPRQPVQLAAQVLRMLEPVTALLPAGIGRWLRGANFLARAGRQLGWLTS